MIDKLKDGKIVKLWCYEVGKQHYLTITYSKGTYTIKFSGKLNTIRKYKLEGVFVKHIEEWGRVHKYSKMSII